ncbi:MAG: hypothetical protein R6V53_07245 [Candidatus Woesearchaeota archaeon]
MFDLISSESSYDDWLVQMPGDEHYDTLSVPLEYNPILSERLEDCAQQLYGFYNEPIHVDQVCVMANCMTNPLRVDVSVNDTLHRRFYVKQYDERRILGKDFYNLLMDGAINFFADDCVVVDNIKGELLADIGFTPLSYRNAVRHEVFFDMIMLDDIVASERNLCVNRAENVFPIDFHLAFSRGVYHYNNTLSGRERELIRIEESTKLARTITRRWSHVESLLGLVETSINRSMANLVYQKMEILLEEYL